MSHLSEEDSQELNLMTQTMMQVYLEEITMPVNGLEWYAKNAVAMVPKGDKHIEAIRKRFLSFAEKKGDIDIAARDFAQNAALHQAVFMKAFYLAICRKE